MARYHISSNGTPAVCHAEKGNCPLGGADGMQNHFDTKEAAQAAADRQAMSGFAVDRLSADKHADMSNEYVDFYRSANVTNLSDLDKFDVQNDFYFRKITPEEYKSLTGEEWNEDLDVRMQSGRHSINSVDVDGTLTKDQEDFVNSIYRGHGNVEGHKLNNYTTDGYRDDTGRNGVWLQKDQPAVLFDDRMNDDSVVLDANPVRRGYYERNEEATFNYKATMTPDEYVNAVGTIYNAGHSRNVKNLSYNEAYMTIQAGSVTRGDIKLKMSAQDKDDINADCGTFAAARKYASEVEGLSNDEINDIVDNEGLVKHFRKESGLSKRDSSNIVKTNLSLLQEKTGFNPDDYDKRTGYVAAEYAMRKPMKDWRAGELKQAIADSPHDFKQKYPDTTVSRYDTMRTELGLHPHAIVDTQPMTEDEITKYKLWDVKDRMILDDPRTGAYNGKDVKPFNGID